MKSTTVEVYKVLDLLIEGRELSYSREDVFEETNVGKRNLEIALTVLIKLRLIRHNKVTGNFEFRPRTVTGKAFLKFYKAVIVQILTEEEEKNKRNPRRVTRWHF